MMRIAEVSWKGRREQRVLVPISDIHSVVLPFLGDNRLKSLKDHQDLRDTSYPGFSKFGHALGLDRLFDHTSQMVKMKISDTGM
jgi:hypothetical protein